MYKLINGTGISVEEAATFITNLNKVKKHHIGFCGTDSDEIVNSITRDLTDVPFDDSFVGAVEDGRLIGLIGLDVDLEDQSAEIWGPFVDPSYDVNLAYSLWDEMIRIVPSTIKNVILFPNVENQLVKTFAEKLQFEEKTDQIILKFSRNQLDNLTEKNIKELTEQDHEAFVNLHDHTFPVTYYNGLEIIDRINDTQKVFVLKDKRRMAGYAYVEAEPDFGEGAIEFIVVDQAYRGKGYGKTLLLTAVKWLFTFNSIREITLCVASDNEGAIRLYRSVGFQIEHELNYYLKSLTK